MCWWADKSKLSGANLGLLESTSSSWPVLASESGEAGDRRELSLEVDTLLFLLKWQEINEHFILNYLMALVLSWGIGPKTLLWAPPFSAESNNFPSSFEGRLLLLKPLLAALFFHLNTFHHSTFVSVPYPESARIRNFSGSRIHYILIWILILPILQHYADFLRLNENFLKSYVLY
jgi:hypothetical protein